MSSTYDCVLQLQNVPQTQIDELYTNKQIRIDSVTDQVFNPHDKIILTNCLNSSSALGLIDHTKEYIKLVKEVSAWGVTGRNKEQTFLLKLLKDNSVRFQMILGPAGTGKTICTYASALEQVFELGNYERVVFTKPTYEVGPSLGAIPGDIDEKFSSFLINYQQIAAELKVKEFFQMKEKTDYMPIQRMRGASFINTLVIGDEVQSLSIHEMKTLCTRIGKGSKLVLMGDLEQIDSKLKKTDTGLYRLATSEKIKSSPLCASVELTKNERSGISALLGEVLS